MNVDATDVGTSILAVFSSVMLVYEWLSLYNKFDYGVLFFAGLLTCALSILIIRKK